MTAAIQKLPYIQPDEKSGLHFDNWIFENHRVRMVSEQSRLTFSDIEFMHRFRRAETVRRRFTPAFANSDEQLRLVLAQQAWSFAHLGCSCVPDDVACDREQLEALCAARIASARRRFDRMSPNTAQWQNLGNLVLSGERQGYLGLRARVAVLAWRLGWNSCEVAADCRITPQLVRQILARLCFTARKFGFETFTQRHKTFGTHHAGWQPRLPRPSKLLRMGRPVVWTPERIEELKQARINGVSWEELATKFGVRVGTVRNTYYSQIPREQRPTRARRYVTESKRKWTHERKNILFELRMLNVPWREIAGRLGLRHASSAVSAYRFFFSRQRRLAAMPESPQAESRCA
jgi:hypothetical protein